MTKTEEIEILKSAIEKLGSDSYLGPWLSSVRAEVELEIRSDFLPSPTLADATARYNARIQEAEAEAARIISSAKTESKRLIDEAVAYARGVRARLAADLRRAAELADR